MRRFSIVSPEGKMGDTAKNNNGNEAKLQWGSFSMIGNAISAVENPSRENISNILGSTHKVRSFYNNILLPNNAKHGDVTIDAHAVAAGLLKPLGGSAYEVAHSFGEARNGVPSLVDAGAGIKGLYPLFADAYQIAAERTGLLPRELQSITWEAVRGLFESNWKNNKNAELVNKLWGDYIQKKATLNETREAILKLAEGITPPTWYEGRGSSGDAKSRSADNSGRLSFDGLPRQELQTERGGDRGIPSGNSKAGGLTEVKLESKSNVPSTKRSSLAGVRPTQTRVSSIPRCSSTSELNRYRSESSIKVSANKRVTFSLPCWAMTRLAAQKEQRPPE